MIGCWGVKKGVGSGLSSSSGLHSKLHKAFLVLFSKLLKAKWVSKSRHISWGSSPWRFRAFHGAPAFNKHTARPHLDMRAATWRQVQPATSARSKEGRCL